MAFTGAYSFDVSGGKVEEIAKRWSDIPVSQKRETLYLANLHAFWSDILHPLWKIKGLTPWGELMHSLDLSDNNYLNLKGIYRIEILESILMAVSQGCLSEDSTKWLILLGTKFDMGVGSLDEAVHWLQKAGEPDITSQIQKLGSKNDCTETLSFVCRNSVYYLRARVFFGEPVLQEWTLVQPRDRQESEKRKNKGNTFFQKGDMSAAVEWYTRAIEFNPENHILYGNRSLCFLRCKEYLKAASDGKRAIVIRPNWPKGHYRFCDALFALGEHQKAVQANLRAIFLCSEDPEGVRDLDQQKCRFQIDIAMMEELRAAGKRKKMKPKRDASRRTDTQVKMDPESLHDTNPPNKAEPHINSSASKNQELDESACRNSDSGEAGTGMQMDDSTETGAKKETTEKMQKKDPHIQDKTKPKNRHQGTHKKTKAEASSGDLVGQFKSVVHDAHSALKDQRCRNAEVAFSQALILVETAPSQELCISHLDKLILTYGHTTALLEIGQPEELAQAKKQFNKIKDDAGREFQCLVYYGMGKVLFKENRFSEALDEFNKALLMVKRQIVPGKLTWPTTTITVQETHTDYLKDRMEEYIEMCKFPPRPDAICRHQTCLVISKIEIYFTDSDFKGFIRLVCCQSCNVEFHISCWKKLKATSFSDKTDKEFLQLPCFTPDCVGNICQIVIFGATGLVKCEFESSVAKSTAPVKQKVKQKCTSLKKVKSKEERRLKRKQHRQAEFLTKQRASEERSSQEDSKSEDGHQKKAPPQTWLTSGDRVLHQINENRQLFKGESPDISVFAGSLRPWIDFNANKEQANTVAAWKVPETLEDAVNLVLERKNRVWARVFIQALSRAAGVSQKLAEWAALLNGAGLEAAREFIERHAEHLEELDLAPLLAFQPLRDAIMEKTGDLPSLLVGAATTVTGCLRAAGDLEVMRLFIWVLEENREKFVSCHQVLNTFFEMDCLCVVNKKMENENQIVSISVYTELGGHIYQSLSQETARRGNSWTNYSEDNGNKQISCSCSCLICSFVLQNSSIKSKNRNRKKKQKESKSIMVFPGSRGGTLREEDEDLFFEEDSLGLLDSNYPFFVPEHLRPQLEEFEGQYNNNRFKTILDNNIRTDPTKENLYDYFAQILEEHGPLDVHDPLLVGELDNFPWEARLLIQESGGLEGFLLGSLRFSTNGTLVGLTTHASSFLDQREEPVVDNLCPLPTYQEDSNIRGPTLNPSAKEFTPLYSEIYTYLPGEPAVFDQGINAINVSGTYNGDISEGFAYPVYSEMYINETFSNVECIAASETNQHAKKTWMRSVPVQTFSKSKDAVLVNTEPYEPFERDKGDMIKKEKYISQLQKQIMQAEEGYTKGRQLRKERISSLEEELMEINQNIEIGNKELDIFHKRLEEEVRKDQQEKKVNQETLKALKNELKELAAARETLLKNIKEKRMEYEQQFSEILDERNQSEAEKLSVEDEVKRYQELCARAAARSLAAEVTMLDCRRQCGLQGLYRYVSEKEAVLTHLKEVGCRAKSPEVSKALNAWQEVLQDAKDKILRTEANYKEQMEQLQKGTRLSSLPPVSVPSPLPTPALPPFASQGSAVRYPSPRLPSAATHVTLPPVRLQPVHRGSRPPTAVAPPQPDPFQGRSGLHPDIPVSPWDGTQGVSLGQQPQVPRAGPQHPATVFEKIIDQLVVMFPHYSRPVLSRFIQEVRSANGGYLNTLTYDVIINRVVQKILDYQENTREQMSATHGLGVREFLPGCRSPTPRCESPVSGRSSTAPPRAWKSMEMHKRPGSQALNVEDPCIICHEEMSAEDLCVLECRHSFHRECIKSWLNEQMTCPTCRDHTLLPEDFPQLPDRPRRGPPAANSFHFS
ncbi:E3 ubiquitin-protein ligase TTC3 isoform X2 [Brienomyrus brachyistius]|nr:E3 ubiquitin-protein ligase TTC3 isoform X2 [Brienomyrus brachyistius]